jgi:hypothetical protein
MWRPFRPRFLLSAVTTRLRAWLFAAGASRLSTSPLRLKHEAARRLQTSLEEAEVRSPDREVGEESTHENRAPKVRHRKGDGCLAYRPGEFPIDILRMAVAVLVLASTVAWSQQMPAPQPLPPGVAIRAEAQPRTATVGDPIRIELTVSLPEGFHARFPELKSQVGDFSVLESPAGPVAPPPAKGREAAGKIESGAGSPGTSRASFTVALFRPGSFEFPSLPIVIRDRSGKEYSAASPPVKVEIRSVLTGKDEKLKGLKKQAEIEDPARWLYRLGLVLVLLTLALLAWLLWRRRRKPESARTELPGLDPYALAEADLRDLTGRGLLERGFVKQFYVGLSEIVKRVLEAGYRISTTERTTSEIMEGLSQISPSAPTGSELARIESFLNGCDLVKFAKYLPSAPENDANIQSAFSILETCRRRGSATAAQTAAAATGVP